MQQSEVCRRTSADNENITDRPLYGNWNGTFNDRGEAEAACLPCFRWGNRGIRLLSGLEDNIPFAPQKLIIHRLPGLTFLPSISSDPFECVDNSRMVMSLSNKATPGPNHSGMRR